MSSNSNTFRQLSVTKICSNLTLIAHTNTGDASHHMYHACKRIKMVLRSHMDDINFADPANISKAHKEVMTQVRTEAIHISNKYKIQVDPIQIKWDRIPSHIRKGFSGHIKLNAKS